MKRFVDYLNIREATAATDAAGIKSGFDQLRGQIGSMFGTLAKAAQNTWGKGSGGLDAKFKQDIISSLEQVIAKLRGPAVKAEAVRTAGEIRDLLIEANDLVSNLRPTGVGASGRQVYSMGDVLRNIQDRIMQSVGDLEKSVLGSKIDALSDKVGTVGDRVSSAHADIDYLGKDVRKANAGIEGLGKKVDTGVDDIRGDVAGYGQRLGGQVDSLGRKTDDLKGKGFDPEQHADLMGRLGGIEKKLDSPPQPLKPDQFDAAQDSIEAIKSLGLHATVHGRENGTDHRLVLIHPATGTRLNPRKLNKAKILSLANQDATFALAHGDDAEGQRFNLGDVQHVSGVVTAFMDKKGIDPNSYMTRDKKFKTKAFGTVHGNALAPIPIDGEKKTTKAAREKAQADAEAKMDAEREARVRANFGGGSE